MILQLVLMMMAGFDPTVLTAHAAPVELNSTTTIAAYVRQVQQEYGLGDDFYETLKYESWGFQNIQSHVPSKTGPNEREDSWGTCQIHLPSHPHITKEQAMDPEWCVEWTAEQFKAGRQSKWTAWRLFHSDSKLLR